MSRDKYLELQYDYIFILKHPLGSCNSMRKLIKQMYKQETTYCYNNKTQSDVSMSEHNHQDCYQYVKLTVI